MSKKRKPGGQPGNQNARTHGFYSDVLNAREIAMVKSLKGHDQEIAVLRLKIKSMLRSSPDKIRSLVDAMNLLARLTEIDERY